MEGYDKLAALISAHRGIDMFRKFGALHAKTLLYMQAELTHLEAQLSDVIREDRSARDAGAEEKRKFQFSWASLGKSMENSQTGLQYRLVMKIRAVQERYCRHLSFWSVLKDIF